MARQIRASAVRRLFGAAALVLAALLLTPIVGLTADNAHGTYSSLAYSNESGDLSGYEVEFIPTNKGLKAVVQVAEGEVDGIYVVDVMQAKNGELSFSFPLGGAGKNATFKGEINGHNLSGTLVLPSGKQPVTLHRGSSYWDR